MTEFEEAVAAVDNTLHHAIDYWQDRAMKAEALLTQPDQEPVVFEKWWEDQGQFCRAGGGEYEKTFAFRAWEAALATPPAAQHQCKWPTCQSEEYQQALAEQINQELVTGVAQRKPLTDAEIQAIHDTYYRRMGPQEFARAIEAAHGIKEQS
jgi:hypothetical protein